MAWLSGWAKRVKLTIDQNDIDATLENFPILIHLSTSSGRESDDVSFVFDELTSDDNRKKIAVTTSDGETQCYVEIEKWDDANEKAWLWAKVPAIASDADTDLYLYYDIAHADNDTYVGDPNSTPAETVWDANFVFVSHMRDDPDNSHIRDSTNNNNDGTKKGINEPALITTGKIADAQDFDGTNDLIDIAHSAELNITALLTLECCARHDGANNQDYVAMFQRQQCTNKGVDSYYFGFNANNRIHLGTFGGNIQSTTASWTQGLWYYYVGTYNSTGLTGNLFVNAIKETLSVNNYDAMAGGTNELRIGGYSPTTGAKYFNGAIDEIRISNVIRTDAWIKATYETGRDHLLDFGSEELAPSAYYHGLKVQGIGELALCDIGTHQLRIRKGGTTYGIELVDTTDPDASALRIKTSSGIKAIRKYT